MDSPSTPPLKVTPLGHTRDQSLDTPPSRSGHLRNAELLPGHTCGDTPWRQDTTPVLRGTLGMTISHGGPQPAASTNRGQAKQMPPYGTSVMALPATAWPQGAPTSSLFVPLTHCPAWAPLGSGAQPHACTSLGGCATPSPCVWTGGRVQLGVGMGTPGCAHSPARQDPAPWSQRPAKPGCGNTFNADAGRWHVSRARLGDPARMTPISNDHRPQ